jgi:hypothetical protein
MTRNFKYNGGISNKGGGIIKHLKSNQTKPTKQKTGFYSPQLVS